MKPTPIADQVRHLREQRFENRARAMMTPRSAPSPAKVKEIADRAEARGIGEGAGCRPPIRSGGGEPASNPGFQAPSPMKPQRKFAESVIATKFIGTEKEIKMSPALATKPKTWDKTLFQKLYLRKRRATTDEARETAEAALREAFPNKRPRAQSAPKTNGDAAPKPAVKAERPKPALKKAAPRKPKPPRKAKKAKRKGRK